MRHDGARGNVAINCCSKAYEYCKKFLRVRTRVNEILVFIFWNVTPRHWVIASRPFETAQLSHLPRVKRPMNIRWIWDLNTLSNIGNQTSSDEFKQGKVKFFPVHYVKKYEGSRDTAELIINLDTRRRCLNSHPGCFTPQKEPRWLLNRRLGWSRSWSGRFGDCKNNLHVPTFEPRTLQHIAYSPYRLTTL
jgi:hypothetical protein